MLSILFMILKITGCIILFILLLVALILTVPICYRFNLDTPEEKPELSFQVSWFFRLLLFDARYTGGRFLYYARIFGVQVLGNQPEYLKKKEEKRQRKKRNGKKRTEEKQRRKKRAKTETGKGSVRENFSREETEKLPLPNTPQKEESEHPTIAALPDKPAPEPVSAQDSPRDSVREEAPVREKRPRRFRRKKQSGRMKNKLASLRKTAAEIKQKYEAYHVAELIPFIRELIFKLFRHIFPRRLSGSLTLGFEDPAATGYFTALMGSLYPLYGRSFSFIPDFHQQTFQGSCRGSGKIRPGYLGYLGILLFKNKDIRTMFFANNKE